MYVNECLNIASPLYASKLAIKNTSVYLTYTKLLYILKEMHSHGMSLLADISSCITSSFTAKKYSIDNQRCTNELGFLHISFKHMKCLCVLVSS